MGAASNRIANMAQGLKSLGVKIDLLCPLPNYPKGKVFDLYKGKFKVKEDVDGISIVRHWIYPTISKNPFLRFLAMISFSLSLWSSFFMLKRIKPDILIVNSPPLLVGYSGLLLAKSLKIKSILNVSDLWPLSALDLGILKKGKLYSFLEKIEHRNYNLADKIIGQSEEIISHITKEQDKKEKFIYRNVPFLKEYKPKNKNEKIKIVYAGLLGYAQGIFSICKNINFSDIGVEFHIYGAGMEQKDIVNYIKESNDSIFFHGSVSAEEIKIKIRENDIALVPLSKPIYGAVPSKIFELMSLGVPILYLAGDGEAKEIIKSQHVGLVTEYGNYQGLKENILSFVSMTKNEYETMSKNCINAHVNKYNLENQISNLDSFITL